MSGRWRGRLIDVQGLEGELALDLKVDGRGRVSGLARTAIGGHHVPLELLEEVSGRAKADRLELELVGGEERPVAILLTARVMEMTGGGLGMCAEYDVSARGFSPLQGGVAALNKDAPVPAAQAARQDAGGPP
jgi:hypothetical protein